MCDDLFRDGVRGEEDVERCGANCGKGSSSERGTLSRFDHEHEHGVFVPIGCSLTAISLLRVTIRLTIFHDLAA